MTQAPKTQALKTQAVAPSSSGPAAVPGLPPPRRAPSWTGTRRWWLPDALTRPVFGRPLAPSRAEWDAVLAALRQGDAPMDAVVAWMFAGGPRQTKALFEQALLKGIDSLPDPPAPLRDFFSLVDTPPPWLRRDLVEAGALAAQTSGEVGFYVLRDQALMGGYAWFSSFNQVLAATGSLHKDVALRLGETGKWLQDVTASGGLDRFSDGFITTIRVRLVHALVRRHLQTNHGWDENTWGVPINQIDMLATYLAFGPVTLLGARAFGVPVTPRDSRAAMHMWRYIGWLSGVREEWLAITERDGLRKLYHTYLTHGLPDEKIALLGGALRDQPLSPPNSQQPSPAEPAGWLARLGRHWQYHKHLSNSALILLPRQRRQLGIPWYAWPWYPLASAPFRFLWLAGYRLRGGEPLVALRRRSRARQQQLLQGYFAGREVDIIRPAAGHPASIDSG